MYYSVAFFGALWCPTHIVLCFFCFFLSGQFFWSVFLIAPSVFSSVYSALCVEYSQEQDGLFIKLE